MKIYVRIVARKLQGVHFAFLRDVCVRLPGKLPMPALVNRVARNPCTLS